MGGALLAAFNASSLMSQAHTSALGKLFFNATAIQPLPVPISRILNFPARPAGGEFLFLTSFITQSTSSSVSGRGISTFLST